MIIHDENTPEQQPSPSVKSSSVPLPIATAGTTRREPSQGPAPPSYAAATSTVTSASSLSTPTDTTPLLSFHHNPHTQNLTHARAANLQPTYYAGHMRPTQTAGYDAYAARAAEEDRMRDINRRTRKRFFKSLLLAVLAYLLIIGFIGSSVDIHVRTPWIDDDGPMAPNPPEPPTLPKPPSDHPEPPQPPGSPPKRAPWPSPRDGDIVYCAGQDTWSPSPPNVAHSRDSFNEDMIISTGEKNINPPFASYNTFTLPVDAIDKGIFSKGRHASGIVVMRAREHDLDDGKIRIAMQASYQFPSALASTNVCLLTRDSGWRGLGIYTTNDFDGSKDIRFSIDITFPKAPSPTSAPRPMGNFTSALSWFTHNINTQEYVSFDRLILTTGSDKIHSDGVVANSTTAASNNGPITGSFNVTRQVSLTTTNALIDVDLNISHKESDAYDGVSAVISTSNGAVKANMGLYYSNETHSDSQGGKFDLVASTKNALVDLQFTTAPVDSILACSVSTSNGPADVHLHPTYEGSVTLVNSHGITGIHQNDALEDPSGRGRSRVVGWDHKWKLWWLGWVGWGEKKKAGQLVVKTSNADNTLWL